MWPNVVSHVTRMSVEVLVTQSAFAGSIVLINEPNNKEVDTSMHTDKMPFLRK
jgi:hypothetical protein